MKLGNTEIILVPNQLNDEEIKNNLKNFYDICNKVFQSEDVFYSSKQIKKMKKDKNKLFL